MPRYALTIEYDGTHYAGWQKQVEQPSVQGAIEEALFKFCGEHVGICGAGRTDAGVHAIGQVAHVDLPKAYDPFRVMQGVNYYLFNGESGHPASQEDAAQDLVATTSNGIAIVHAQEVENDFHARFSAVKRHYLYRIINRRARLGLEAGRAWHMVDALDVDAMREAANILLGHHDFTSFRDTQCQAKSPLKTLDELDIRHQGNEVHVIASAQSFLHHQVRIMVGTLSMVGKGKWQPQDVAKILAAKDRTKAGPTAPPDGLYLTRVEY